MQKMMEKCKKCARKNVKTPTPDDSVHGRAPYDLAQVTFVDTTDLSTAEILKNRELNAQSGQTVIRSDTFHYFSIFFL